ncbi:metallophosphoesterase [Priestia megaterium]|nr:metallophosphoesterase [Priestia megaterium]
MNIRILLSVIGAIGVYNLLVFYIGWNGWIWLTHMTNMTNIFVYSAIVIFLAYSYVLSRLFHSITVFKVIGSYWLGFLQYAVLFLPVSNLVVFILSQSSISMHQAIQWTGAGTLFVFAAIFIYGAYNAYSPVIRKYNMTIHKESGKHNTLRIAMASDMHFGTLSGINHLRKLVHHVNQIKPDIILLPGDIIDDDPTPFIEKKMDKVMSEMNAPLGVYGVLGNHEYYGGKIPEFLAQMKKINIPILMDEIIKIDESFYLLGRKDKTDRSRKSFEELVDGLNENLPLIAMDHQPSSLQEAEKSNVDLLLCGHTHRGQMAPNHLITNLIFELDWGYQKKNGFHTVVSSGFGFWGPPLRIGSRSEIIQIDITFVS